MRSLPLLIVILSLALTAGLAAIPAVVLAGEPAAAEDTGPAVPPPLPAPGPGTTQQYPVPMGSPLIIDGNRGRFAIRVVRVIPDAYALLQSYNQFAFPPAPGSRQIIVRVQMTNLTPRPEPVMVFRAHFALLGSSPRLISPLSAQVRDRLWAELPSGMIAEGEIPFEVRQDDQGLVLIYDGDNAGSQRYYFALE